MRLFPLPILLLWLSLLTSCDPRPVELELITPRSAIDKAIAEEFAKLLDESAAVHVTLVPTPDEDNTALAALIAGSGDLAFAHNNESFHPDVTTVIPLYPTVLHIAYRKPLQDLEPDELLSKHKVYTGPPGSVSRRLLQDAAERFGVDPAAIDYATENDRCVEVVVAFAPVQPEIAAVLEQCGEYQFRSMGTPADVGRGSPADGAALLDPKVRPFIIPVDTYADLTPEPVVTIAVDKLLVASAELPETVVYDLIREVIRVQPALSSLYPPLFSGMTEEFDATRSTFIIHPGAQAYLDRDAPSVYERYSGVAEVAVTVFIALMSGAFAVVRIYKIRRKNRIDTFYSAAIDIRNAAQDSTDIAVRAKAIAEIRALQNRAFDMLVGEKLSADESFRIFITLSNDVIEELRSPTTS